MSEQKSFTPSAVKDYLREYIQNDKESREFVESLLAYPKSTFIIDPSENETLLDIAFQYREQFPEFVKTAIVQYLQSLNPDRKGEIAAHLEPLQIKISETQNILLHDLDSDYEGMPVTTECQVITADNPETYTISADVRCDSCGASHKVYSHPVTKELPLPPKCQNEDCDSYKSWMSYDPNSYRTSMIRRITIQEPMEQARHGSPSIMSCEVKGKDVKDTFLGDRKKITGIFRSRPQPKKKTNKIVFQAISVIDAEDREIIMPTDAELERYQQLVSENKMLDMLCNSFAPKIYTDQTMRLAKTVIILSLIGGIDVDDLRGRINCLLVGDPSTAKSKLLEFIEQVYQNSSYVNAATASGPGMTVAYDDRLKAPRIGPIPLRSGGVVAIDELGRLKGDDIDYLLQCMESGKIKYTKGGYDFAIPAQTTIISAANPKGNRYDPEMSVVDNINMPEPILTRYDFIVNIRDIPEYNIDESKIDHIMDMRSGKQVDGIMEPRELMAYLNYVRNLKPVFEESEARKIIKKFYHDLRQLDSGKGSRPIDIRLFESIYRVSQAVAKMNQAKKVTTDHVQTAIVIYKETLKTFGIETERDMKQVSMEEAVNTKDQAFRKVWRYMEQQHDSDYIDPVPFLKELVSQYPKIFPSTEKADEYFEKKSDKKEILRKGGRYRLP